MNSESRVWLDRARRRMQAAQLMIDGGLFDFAVGESFLIMYHVAQACLLNEGIEAPKRSAVIPLFGITFAKTRHIPVEFHRWLIDARKARVAAVEKATGPRTTSQQATLHIDHAEQFIALAERFIGPPSPGDEETI